MSAKRQRPVNIADLSVKLLKGMTAARGTQALPATAGSRLFFFTGSSILAQTQRQKFLEGRGAGRENLFPKRFSSPQAFLSSNLQAPACIPKQKIPGGRGQKRPPRAEAARGSRTIFGSLLSHMTLCSIIGDGSNFGVRNGVRCTLSSMATKKFGKFIETGMEGFSRKTRRTGY